MTWFKVDDSLAFHAKVVQAGNAAMGLWVRAGSWSAQQLTDGFVPGHIVTALGTKSQAKALVAVNLWVPDGDGYRFHQWGEDGRQPTREEVEAKRAEWRDKKRKQRRTGSGQFAPSAPMSLGDTLGDSPQESHRPVPSRPDPTTSTSVEGGSHVSRGSSAAPPLFPDHCQRHADVAEPGACGGCADVRKANKVRPLYSVPSETKRCFVHAESYLTSCRGCAADRLAGETA